MKNLKSSLLKVFKRRLVRFVGVGIIGEILYILLFAIFTSLGYRTTFSVLPSGLICILFNSYMHARFSFKINYGLKFLIQYIIIQIICMISTYIFSFLFVWIGMNSISIGFATLIIWGTFSFLIMSKLVNFQKKK